MEICPILIRYVPTLSFINRDLDHAFSGGGPPHLWVKIASSKSYEVPIEAVNGENAPSCLFDNFTASLTVPVAPLLDGITKIWTIFGAER